MPENPTLTPLTRMELVQIAQEVDILKRMGEEKTRILIIEYAPFVLTIRDPQTMTDEEGAFVQPHHTLRFIIEDAMFGGEVFAAVTCNGLVVVRPFLWTGYEALAKMKINVVPNG